MTREEAVSIIEERIHVTEYVNSSYVDSVDIEALRIVIEALKLPEPCEDAVSRASMLETYSELYDVFDDSPKIIKELHKIYDKLRGLSSVHPKHSECEDAVSREALLELSEWFGERATYDNPMPKGVEAVPVEAVKKLPSVTPKPMTGEWIIRSWGNNAQCSNCGISFRDVYDIDNYDEYCRHCGARMIRLRGDNHGTN